MTARVRVIGSEAKQFWSKVDRRGPDECWTWIAAKNWAGYGMFTSYGRTRVAHRAAWAITGHVLEPGLTLDHLCRNRACVNPAHLEQVVLTENL